MRKLRSGLIVSMAFAAGLVIRPDAHAQMAVIDSANLAQTTLTAARSMNELRQLIAQYNQLVVTYRMLTTRTDVTGLAPSLGTQFVQNPLPAANLIGGLINGEAAATGAGVTFYNQNHVYTPTDGSAASRQLIANGNSIANIEGLAASNLQSIQLRLAQLPSLEADLSAATSITQVNAINGRIALEENYVQAQQAQAQNLALLASEQAASQRQQEEEEHTREALAIAAKYRAAAQ